MTVVRTAVKILLKALACFAQVVQRGSRYQDAAAPGVAGRSQQRPGYLSGNRQMAAKRRAIALRANRPAEAVNGCSAHSALSIPRNRRHRPFPTRTCIEDR